MENKIYLRKRGEWKLASGRKHSSTVDIMSRLMKNRNAVCGLIIFALLVLSAVFVPMFSGYGMSDMDMVNKCQGPSAAHLFGTDDFGRDIFIRIFYGGRYSLSISLIAVLLSTVIGMAIGAVAGYFGGAIDNILMRILDAIQAIPSLLLTIIVSAVLGTGFDKTILALAITRIPSTVRLLRASVLQTREEQYLEAAEAIGCSHIRRIIRYVLPNSWSPIIVHATMGVANTVLSLASLSYIGLGISPPTPEWGAMLSMSRGYLRDYPYMLIFPGVFICLTVLSLNMFGDGLRDALDPKLKN